MNIFPVVTFGKNRVIHSNSQILFPHPIDFKRFPLGSVPNIVWKQYQLSCKWPGGGLRCDCACCGRGPIFSDETRWPYGWIASREMKSQSGSRSGPIPSQFRCLRSRYADPLRRDSTDIRDVTDRNRNFSTPFVFYYRGGDEYRLSLL